MLTGKERFDPYPFILLNLVLSCIAALQAPIIMMSQNRQEARDRLRDEQDFAVNLKAEREVADLQQDIAHLQAQVTELTTLQQQALGLLQQTQTEPRQ